MIKKVITLLICLICVFSFSGCKRNKIKQIPDDAIATEVDLLLSQMSKEEKIMQMIICEIKNDGVLPSPVPSGVILFDENFTTAQKTSQFISSLSQQSEIPLIISTDQEGGKVQRLSALSFPKATYIPDMYALGKTNDMQLAKSVGEVMAKEMRSLSINLTFAPVLDVYSNKNTVIAHRSFGENPHTVSLMSENLADGLLQNGIMPCFKHFPGHGDTDKDSHISLPIINKTKDELYKTELIPFENAIENNAQIIMIGHIALPKITGNTTPATLSKEIITDLLKNEMGFEGIVITDALNMGALTKNYSQEDIYKMAVEAGNDILLMPQDISLAVKTIEENFNDERIDQSVKKILYFKLKYLTELPKFDLSVIGSNEHQDIIDKIK